MMHHCTKFCEYDMEGGRIFGNMTEALDHPHPKKKKEKKNWKKNEKTWADEFNTEYRLSSDLHVYLMV